MTPPTRGWGGMPPSGFASLRFAQWGFLPPFSMKHKLPKELDGATIQASQA
jgi:hypothetical protein